MSTDGIVTVTTYEDGSCATVASSFTRPLGTCGISGAGFTYGGLQVYREITCGTTGDGYQIHVAGEKGVVLR